MILETIDECDSGAYACICLGIFIYKLLVENKEYALVEIITLDKFDECDSCAYVCIFLCIFIYKLLVENKEYALVEIITLDKI